MSRERETDKGEVPSSQSWCVQGATKEGVRLWLCGNALKAIKWEWLPLTWKIPVDNEIIIELCRVLVLVTTRE